MCAPTANHDKQFEKIREALLALRQANETQFTIRWHSLERDVATSLTPTPRSTRFQRFSEVSETGDGGPSSSEPTDLAKAFTALQLPGGLVEERDLVDKDVEMEDSDSNALLDVEMEGDNFNVSLDVEDDNSQPLSNASTVQIAEKSVSTLGKESNESNLASTKPVEEHGDLNASSTTPALKTSAMEPIPDATNRNKEPTPTSPHASPVKTEDDEAQHELLQYPSVLQEGPSLFHCDFDKNGVLVIEPTLEQLQQEEDLYKLLYECASIFKSLTSYIFSSLLSM